MGLQEKIRTDLKEAMLSKDTARVSTLRIIMGEFARQTKKELTDKEVQGVIRQLVKSEAEMLTISGAESSDYMEILESYLPKQPTEAEIRAWITDNINIGDFANKMQAMKPIMTNFGGAADGNLVRKILESL
ncbi:MAG: GatB/YqeY domain-containing protein [Desulfobulbaceae bacterium]|nr:GatB/YqeY domain-containing protein [Desulfobulbaceae bacterium]